MLTKAANHLRPFIRVPSSQPLPSSPEHFTANPSLLHHLPQGGSGHSLVSQAQSSASTAGNSGASGAGRSGYSSAGAGSGSGYTGHARTFLSLSQTSSIDPSSSLTSGNDDSSTPNVNRSSLILKHRYNSSRKVVKQNDELPRSIHWEQGRSRLKVIELENGEGWEKEDRLLEGPSRRRRGSIAFPNIQSTHFVEPMPTPTVARTNSPRPDGMGRSRSTLDIWQVGIPRSRAIKTRPLSTNVTHSPLPQLEDLDIDDTRPIVRKSPLPESRVLSQPNRVIMDLAGHEITHLTRLGGVRRNSVSTMERVVDSSLPPSMLASEEGTVDKNDPDWKIWQHMVTATQFKDRTTIEHLVAHYRSPRDVSPFSEDQVGVPEGIKQFPLPDGYTVGTYNACLDALVQTRLPGESIVQILDIYNEMLERDLIPNGRTYSIVIRALCLREMDIAAAVRKGQERKQWAEWSETTLGEKSAEIDGMEGHQNEANLASAFKLFRAAVLFHERGWMFRPPTYVALLQASASSLKPDVTGSLEVLRHAQTRNLHGGFGLYKHAFEVLGAAGELTKLHELWQEFTTRKTGSKLIDWVSPDDMQQSSPPPAEWKTILFQKRWAWQSAITAFVTAGDYAKAAELMEIMLSAEKGSQESVENNLPPRAIYLNFWAFILTLAKAGQVELAISWYDRIHGLQFEAETQGDQLPMGHMARFVDCLILKGELDKALEVLVNELNNDQFRDTLRTARLYSAFAARAKNSEDPSAALEKLDELVRLLQYRPSWSAMTAHFEALAKIGRYQAIPALLDALPTTSEDNTSMPHAIMCDLEIPFVTRMDLVRAFHRHSRVLDQEVANIIVDQYLIARVKVSSPDEIGLSQGLWNRLVASFNIAVTETGEYDEALLKLLEDLAKINTDSQVLSSSVRGAQQLAANVVDRFGFERAHQLLEPLGEGFGALITSYRPKPAPDPIYEFPLPPTPTSMISEPVPEYSSSLHVVPELSRTIDSHIARDAPITAEQAYALIRKNLEENTVPHPESIGRLLVSFSRTNDEPKVRELYMLAQTIIATAVPPQYQSNVWAGVEDSMLIACCHLGHLEQAGMHRARLVENGLAPSADAYASMIAHSKDTTDDALVARELFAESQAFGVRPHLYLYNTIISKLSKARKAESALELFVQMKKEGLRPSSVTYGAVINACCRVGDAESAATLFDEMASMPNFKPRVPPFNTMMQFHLQTRPSREQVLHYYNALRTAKVSPSAHTYKLLLDAYSILPPIDLTEMERVFHDLLNDNNVNVQGTHWASLITAYGIHGNDLTKALDTFNGIPTHPSTPKNGIYIPEPIVWEAILNVISQRGTIAQVEEMRERMIQSGARATAYVYNVLISAYSSAGAIDKARQIFGSMGDSIVGVAAPNNHPTLLTSSGQVKPSTVTPEPTDVVYREPSTYEAMIRAELIAGTREGAETVLRMMEERRYPVAVFMRARAILDEPLDVIL